MTTAGAVGMSSSIASIAAMVASMVSLTNRIDEYNERPEMTEKQSCHWYLSFLLLRRVRATREARTGSAESSKLSSTT